MPVRTFQAPTSLNGTLAKETNGVNGVNGTAMSNDAPRSAQAAKDATNDFSKSEQNPLGTARNPNSKPGITFAAQDNLPKLPIPELESSCNKYLAALQPLQSPKEQQETRAAIRDFLKSDGPELQEKLKKYAAGKANYIEQFCKHIPLYPPAIRLTRPRVRLLSELRQPGCPELKPFLPTGG